MREVIHYQCESCDNIFECNEHIYKCFKCGKEICSACSYNNAVAFGGNGEEYCCGCLPELMRTWMMNNDQLKQFYANHPDKFIEEFLGIRLPFYQVMILRLMSFGERLKRQRIYCKHWVNCLTNDNWVCRDCKYRRLFK